MDAWLADEVGEQRLAGIVLRGAQIGRVAMLLGFGVSVGLAMVDIRLPILVCGLGTIALAAFYAIAMPETGFRPLPRSERSTFGSMVATGREGLLLVRGSHALLAIFGIAALIGMWSESYDRLWEAHLIEDVGLPEMERPRPGSVVRRDRGRRDAARHRCRGSAHTTAGERGPGPARRALAGFNIVLLVGALGFALAVGFWAALVFVFVASVARNVAVPLFSVWLNRSIKDSGVRATVISITSQADAVGQWTGGPALGAMGNVFSIRAALAAGALCLLPALGLYRWAIRHQTSAPNDSESAVEKPPET